MQISQTTLAALFKGYRAIYLEAYQAGKTFWEKFAMRTTSSAGEELYHWLGAIPGMRKLVDEIQIQNVAGHKYTITNDEFESTIGVRQADIERDSFGIYNPLFSALGMSARQHMDELLATLMVAGFTATDYTGSAFFAADKEPIAGGTKFTNFTTKRLSQTNFRTARKNIKSRLNAKGRAMNLGINLVLCVAPKNEDVARDILLADRNANGATNTDKGTASLEVWPQLGALNDEAWFLLESGLPYKPFIMQVEKEVELASLTTMDSDHVFKKHEFLYQAYGRYNAGYGFSELAFGSDGSTPA